MFPFIFLLPEQKKNETKRKFAGSRSEAKKWRFSTAPDNIRSLGFGAGMGLPNMKRYSDSITIDTALGKGTKILMTVNLS